jgi:hypothetical protein
VHSGERGHRERRKIAPYTRLKGETAAYVMLAWQSPAAPAASAVLAAGSTFVD